MRGVVLESFGDVDHFKLKEVPLPVPKKNEVRIRIQSIGFNPVDYKMRKGKFPIEAPVILGVDCSGIIDAMGKEAKDFKEGDEVMAFALGRQASNGTYAQYMCIDASFVVKKPKNISFDEAAAFPTVALTAYRTLIATGAAQSGRPIFIAGGAGGVGCIAIQLAQYLKTGPIFSTAGNEQSKNMLVRQLKLKKEQILIYSGLGLEEMKQKILEMNHGNYFPAAFDFVGGTMKQLCFAIADILGHVVTIVREKDDFSVPIWNGKESCFTKSLSLHFVNIAAQSFYGKDHSWPLYQMQLQEMVHLLEGKHLVPFIHHLGTFSCETVQQAHRLLEEGHTQGKLVVSLLD
ncbi:MAG TPA: alcohol dehydrogenase catalytic domain-containing protein [Rhabdochlamydiaceae bacterium]|nr:alcohol dehydrogenase catalytic domain-containing protein [Rhabdochlamydiaceae bacterium]